MELSEALDKIKTLEKDLATEKGLREKADSEAKKANTDLATVTREAADRRIKAKDLETENATLKSENKTLKESGGDKVLKKELEDLKTQNQGLQETVDKIAADRKEALDKKIESLNDDQKALIPDFGEDSEKTMAWIATAENKGVFGRDGIKVKTSGEKTQTDLKGLTGKQKIAYARQHPESTGAGA